MHWSRWYNVFDKTLAEEQADMRQRWADPSYRWANDSDLRRSKQGRPRGESTEYQPALPSSVPRTSGEVAKGKQRETEVDDEEI